MVRLGNPIGFTPLPVTIICLLVYAALFAVLITTHHTIAPAPTSTAPEGWNGVNISRAWQDVQELSRDHHPYNSRGQDRARDFLQARIEEILVDNGAEYAFENETVLRSSSVQKDKAASKPVTLFSDKRSHDIYPGYRTRGQSPARASITYFEAINLMVYIRGKDDDQDAWWKNETAYQGPGGVLVNAHYDSVSSGYGATDNGMGVASVLQLISHFTKEGNRPKRGIVALLNSGEEDNLNGAHAFARHPLAKFPHTFLNLEGAAAGGKALLFRSTDSEVTKYYGQSKNPLGTIITDDGFKMGLVSSGTDYSVFVNNLGMRGLDVAFYNQRARYHTNQDDARDASIDSLWHMLSASLTTVQGLSDDTSSTFQGPEEDNGGKKVNAGQGSQGVWFDVLGQTFGVLQLRSLFGISVALLVAGPILLLLIELLLLRSDKWYPLSRQRYLHSSDDDEPVKLQGLRGFFRFPLTFIVASAAVVALAFLMTKINPYIVYSSQYSVWTMLLTAWLCVAWFFLSLGDAVRPTALSRFFTLVWMYALSWLVLVAATVAEDRYDIGSAYFFVIYNASILITVLISYLELFGLPSKSKYVEHVAYGPGADVDQRVEPRHANEDSGSPVSARPGSAAGPARDEEEDADERTSLLGQGDRQTFRYGGASRRSEDATSKPLLLDPLTSRAYGSEQGWSSSLPTWTWLLQFILLGPINVIIVGQISLIATTALHQTPADGNSVLTIYLFMAGLSILLLLPLSPWMHRIKWQLPTLFFLIMIGVLVYNLIAFPFSRDNRLKVFFVQRLDLDTGKNQVAVIGLPGYVEQVVESLPSARGKEVVCKNPREGDEVDLWARRSTLTSCIYEGLMPNVVPEGYMSETSPTDEHAEEVRQGVGAPYWNTTSTSNIDPSQLVEGEVSSKPRTPFDWLYFAAAHTRNDSSVDFLIQGQNTRGCTVAFDSKVTNIHVSTMSPSGDGNASSSFKSFKSPLQNVKETTGGYKVDGGDKGVVLKLWSREFDDVFRVSVDQVGSDGEKQGSNGSDGKKKKREDLTGYVSCIWSDANVPGTIPAYDELVQFAPVWAAATKGADGLVEGFRRFEL